MAGVAIADWVMNYEDSSDLLRSYQRMLFNGGPDEHGEAMRTGSPLTYVDDVRAPVLIIQGRNDTRTPARPIERYVERLEARGHPVEIEWFDAGHMGGDDELSIHHQSLMLDFAKRVLGRARSTSRQWRVRPEHKPGTSGRVPAAAGAASLPTTWQLRGGSSRTWSPRRWRSCSWPRASPRRHRRPARRGRRPRSRPRPARRNARRRPSPRRPPPRCPTSTSVVPT